MRIYHGPAALPDFRRQRLLRQLQKVDASIEAVDAQYIHFVDAKNISPKDDKQLQELLNYGDPLKDSSDGQLLLVVPRPGTISPWSSKATDIARNSGLVNVQRIERGTAYYINSKKSLHKQAVIPFIHDRMTEAVLDKLESAEILFQATKPKPLKIIDISNNGKKALEQANTSMGLALSDDEVDYLHLAYKKLGRNPTDAELMMFGVLNSEHCRHKIFNANWVVDGMPTSKSLFKMIKNTYEKAGDNVLSAYSDNAAVIKGGAAEWFFPDPVSKDYQTHTEPAHLVAKVETHNHPTAIAPFPGAATGVGGEIRDGAATGRGSRSKAGLSGYSVSNLRIPGAIRAWEKDYGKPGQIASPLDIMIEAPLGAAGFNNEFGRPNLGGYFRTYEQSVPELDKSTVWGYHKPIMIAGGVGNIRNEHVKKSNVQPGAKIIVLGGPAMKIGLGGGAASSMRSGESEEELDFASVQRANAEIQRRAQEVINSCWSHGDKNPIISIHDAGAGGLSTSVPEMVHDQGLGAKLELRDIPNADPGMSPMEIWCNEAQERYVLAINEKDLATFAGICQRERCPFAVIGETTTDKRLIINDKLFSNQPVDLPLDILFGSPPKMTRRFNRQAKLSPPFDFQEIDVEEAIERVLHLPSVGSKKFLITIGDRTVGGLVVRDQMVGPWQVPVSDVAVSASSYQGQTGEAMAMGERTPLALIDAPSSARMAVGEAITNIAAAVIAKLSDVKLSANWMAAAGYNREDQNLYDSVKALGQEFCPALGLTIPVGKDSLSMRTLWHEKGKNQSVTSPLSVIISAFAPVADTSLTLTPQLQPGDTSLILIDLGRGKNRLGGSALAQVYNRVGNVCPDAEPEILRNFFGVIQKLNKQGKILAYHDRSDGGLITALCEMSFASRLGLEVDIAGLPGTATEILFNEELGVLIQVKSSDLPTVLSDLKAAVGRCVYDLAKTIPKQEIVIKNKSKLLYSNSRVRLERMWADTSYQIQKLRDNPDCAEEELNLVADDKYPGLSVRTTFNLIERHHKNRPKVAILREQGVNGHVEMAAAFDLAGFRAVDVHLTDLAGGKVSLDDFAGLVSCGGFSYGDVLGAGEGIAKSILFNYDLRKMFGDFFARPDSFSLGVCNGCQMFAALKDIIPGAEMWPRFLKNKSEQFEARLALVKINKSPSIFFQDMEGSYLPIPTAHGEGRAEFSDSQGAARALHDGLVPLQFIDNYGKVSEKYPSNPNGSPQGITALTTPDGRTTIIMPHPERVFLTKQLSWHPSDWGQQSPWFKLFQNARDWAQVR
ncbi:phosphoribosylformylglycinamidine synthase [Candidatus Saccharibacteria bacterium]|nr:phosphoribosylformylglycinamidine synthase [Candidatus Saccharibacteria bacterium]